MLYTAGLVLVGLAAWVGMRRAGATGVIRVWWAAVILLVAGIAVLGLGLLVAQGGDVLGALYLGALLIGLSAALGIPASVAVLRQASDPISPPR